MFSTFSEKPEASLHLQGRIIGYIVWGKMDINTGKRGLALGS
jgi:hypothetical protein